MLKKLCHSCGIIKDSSEFYKNRARKDGLQTICKKCGSIRGKKYYRDHKEQIDDQHKGYYEGNKEQITERHTRYARDHREELRGYSRRYGQTSNGKVIRRQRSQRCYARKKNLESTLTIKQWKRILKNQGNRCNICGKRFCKSRPATQDHIISVTHNGGYTSNNIQALCSQCNSSKHARLDPQFIQTWTLL